jgi:hypothetical protein
VQQNVMQPVIQDNVPMSVIIQLMSGNIFVQLVVSVLSLALLVHVKDVINMLLVPIHPVVIRLNVPVKEPVEQYRITAQPFAPGAGVERGATVPPGRHWFVEHRQQLNVVV